MIRILAVRVMPAVGKYAVFAAADHPPVHPEDAAPNIDVGASRFFIRVIGIIADLAVDQMEHQRAAAVRRRLAPEIHAGHVVRDQRVLAVHDAEADAVLMSLAPHGDLAAGDRSAKHPEVGDRHRKLVKGVRPIVFIHADADAGKAVSDGAAVHREAPAHDSDAAGIGVRKGIRLAGLDQAAVHRKERGVNHIAVVGRVVQIHGPGGLAHDDDAAAEGEMRFRIGEAAVADDGAAVHRKAADDVRLAGRAGPARDAHAAAAVACDRDALHRDAAAVDIDAGVRAGDRAAAVHADVRQREGAADRDGRVKVFGVDHMAVQIQRGFHALGDQQLRVHADLIGHVGRQGDAAARLQRVCQRGPAAGVFRSVRQRGKRRRGEQGRQHRKRQQDGKDRFLLHELFPPGSVPWKR